MTYLAREKIKTAGEVANVAAKELCEKAVAKIRSDIASGAPMTLALASVIRAEARASRDLELGRDLITLADCFTLESYAGM